MYHPNPRDQLLTCQEPHGFPWQVKTTMETQGPVSTSSRTIRFTAINDRQFAKIPRRFLSARIYVVTRPYKFAGIKWICGLHKVTRAKGPTESKMQQGFEKYRRNISELMTRIDSLIMYRIFYRKFERTYFLTVIKRKIGEGINKLRFMVLMENV